MLSDVLRSHVCLSLCRPQNNTLNHGLGANLQNQEYEEQNAPINDGLEDNFQRQENEERNALAAQRGNDRCNNQQESEPHAEGQLEAYDKNNIFIGRL